MPRFMLFILAVLALLAQTAATCAVTVNDIARIQGQDESVLQGLGLIVGLSNTGDSGKDLVMARPLLQVLKNNGDPLADPKEIERTRSVALVMVMCRIPGSGAREGDQYDVTVSTVNSATSLRGGRLYLAPLTGPIPGSAVYAIASGTVELEDEKTPTSARVHDGAQIIKEIRTGRIGDSFNLVLRPYRTGWAAASEVASSINQIMYGRTSKDIALAALPAIATPLDDHTVRIDVPPAERPNPAAFIAEILATDVNATQLSLPAQVICNKGSGAILVTGDVEIDPVNITHKDLVITTTIPALVPTPQDPLIDKVRWASVQTGAKPSEKAKLQDLLAAFKQLDIPAGEQIAILGMINKAGKLHARLVIE
jgi:flagellar P-ring protein precursor FlgI